MSETTEREERHGARARRWRRAMRAFAFDGARRTSDPRPSPWARARWGFCVLNFGHSSHTLSGYVSVHRIDSRDFVHITSISRTRRRRRLCRLFFRVFSRAPPIFYSFPPLERPYRARANAMRAIARRPIARRRRRRRRARDRDISRRRRPIDRWPSVDESVAALTTRTSR